MAVVAPEEAAAMFARNPELADRPEAGKAMAAVKTALQAKQQAHDAVAKVAPKETAQAVSRPAQRATRVGLNNAIKALPTGSAQTATGKALVRLIVAFAAFIIALELASYISGRYFNWNLGQGAQKLQGAAQYVGLYPGQQAAQPVKAS